MRLLREALFVLGLAAASALHADLLAQNVAGTAATVSDYTRLPQNIATITLSQAPLVHIGVAVPNPSYEFNAIADVRLMPNGEIAIADKSRQIRFFNSSGNFVRSFGREGDGPGEFRQIYWFSSFGPDSIVVFDNQANRLVILSQGGVFKRSFMTVPADSTRRRPYPMRPALANRTFLATEILPPTKVGETEHIPRWRLVRLSESGIVRSDVASFAGRKQLIPVLAGPPIPIDSTGRSAIGVRWMPFLIDREPGTLFAAAGTRIYTMDSESGSLQIFGADNRLTNIVRLDKQQLIGPPNLFPANDRAKLTRLMMLGADDGTLWIQLAPPDVATVPVNWLVVNPNGTLAGRATIPSSFRPTHIVAGRIAGIVTGSDDVQTVAVYGYR